MPREVKSEDFTWALEISTKSTGLSGIFFLFGCLAQNYLHLPTYLKTFCSSHSVQFSSIIRAPVKSPLLTGLKGLTSTTSFVFQAAIPNISECPLPLSRNCSSSIRALHRNCLIVSSLLFLYFEPPPQRTNFMQFLVSSNLDAC